MGWPILGLASPNCGRIGRMPGCETTQLPCRMAFVAARRGGLRFATRAVGSFAHDTLDAVCSLCLGITGPGPTVGLTTRRGESE